VNVFHSHKVHTGPKDIIIMCTYNRLFQTEYALAGTFGVGVGFNAPPPLQHNLAHFRGGLHSQSLDWY